LGHTSPRPKGEICPLSSSARSQHASQPFRPLPKRYLIVITSFCGCERCLRKQLVSDTAAKVSTHPSFAALFVFGALSCGALFYSRKRVENPA
jgi:hypothetical protein